jgi:hypothetical protein
MTWSEPPFPYSSGVTRRAAATCASDSSQLRKARGFTQAAMADLLNVSHAEVSQMSGGLRPPASRGPARPSRAGPFELARRNLLLPFLLLSVERRTWDWTAIASTLLGGTASRMRGGRRWSAFDASA